MGTATYALIRARALEHAKQAVETDDPILRALAVSALEATVQVLTKHLEQQVERAELAEQSSEWTRRPVSQLHPMFNPKPPEDT